MLCVLETNISLFSLLFIGSCVSKTKSSLFSLLFIRVLWSLNQYFVAFVVSVEGGVISLSLSLSVYKKIYRERYTYTNIYIYIYMSIKVYIRCKRFNEGSRWGGTHIYIFFFSFYI